MLCGYERLRLKYTPAKLPAIITTNTHVTPQSWVVSWYDFKLISAPCQVELCLVGYMRKTNRHQFQKCVRSSAVSSEVIITSKSLPVSLCANSRRRQADVPWALARPRAHTCISREARNGISSPGRLDAVSVARTFYAPICLYHYMRIQSSQLKPYRHAAPSESVTAIMRMDVICNARARMLANGCVSHSNAKWSFNNATHNNLSISAHSAVCIGRTISCNYHL